MDFFFHSLFWIVMSVLRCVSFVLLRIFMFACVANGQRNRKPVVLSESISSGMFWRKSGRKEKQKADKKRHIGCCNVKYRTFLLFVFCFCTYILMLFIVCTKYPLYLLNKNKIFFQTAKFILFVPHCTDYIFLPIATISVLKQPKLNTAELLMCVHSLCVHLAS